MTAPPLIVTGCGAARGPRAGPPDIEPPQQAVLRVDRARLPALVDPRCRQDLRVAPAAATQVQQAEARVIARGHPEAAAPVRAAGHRRHLAPVDLDPRVGIGPPLPP